MENINSTPPTEEEFPMEVPIVRQRARKKKSQSKLENSDGSRSRTPKQQPTGERTKTAKKSRSFDSKEELQELMAVEERKLEKSRSSPGPELTEEERKRQLKQKLLESMIVTDVKIEKKLESAQSRETLISSADSNRNRSTSNPQKSKSASTAPSLHSPSPLVHSSSATSPIATGPITTEGVQWKRNPEAEKIMQMLKMEALREPILVKKIDIEQKEEEVATVTSSPEKIEDEEERKKREKMQKRLSRKSTNSFRNFRKSSRNEFTIERSESNVSDSLEKFDSEILSISGESNNGEVSKRTKVATEILITEKHYVKSIEVLIEKYMKPLLEKAGELEIPVLTIKKIFSNINLILNVNSQLLKDIEHRVRQWNELTVLGDIFVDVAPYLKIYDTYSNNYDESLNILKECMKKENFNAFLAQCDTSHDLNLKIEALLIGPVQRIPRYILLLNDLLNSTIAEHPDLKLIREAIPIVQRAADHINNNIKEAENLKKFMTISSQGAISLLKAHRNLIKEGMLKDEVKKRVVHIYLFSDILIILSEANAKNKANLLVPQFQWPLHLVWITGGKDYLQIIGPTNTYKLKVANAADDLGEWSTLLSKSFEEHIHRLKTTKDQELQLERAANMNVTDSVRFGSFVFANTASYSGWWVDGMMEGQGKFLYFGSSYVGNFHKNQKTGEGAMIYSTGEMYKGFWLYDRPSGKGVLTYANGDSFNGEWLNGQKHGIGVLNCINGDTFEGQWANNFPEGIGTMTYNNKSLYTGNWLRGFRNHYGVLTIESCGEKYEGLWVNGKREGKGKMKWGDDSTYDGNWKAGMRDGYGVHISSEGKYDGEWVNDRKEGKGTMEYSNSNVYVGNWKNGFYHGSGKITYQTGFIRYFEGEWQYGKKHGKGVLLFMNGDKYDGYFKNDVMHGMGEFEYKNESKIVGKWHKGVLEGKGDLFLPKSEKNVVTPYHGTYKDSLLQDKGNPSIDIHTLPAIQLDGW